MEEKIKAIDWTPGKLTFCDFSEENKEELKLKVEFPKGFKLEMTFGESKIIGKDVYILTFFGNYTRNAGVFRKTEKLEEHILLFLKKAVEEMREEFDTRKVIEVDQNERNFPRIHDHIVEHFELKDGEEVLAYMETVEMNCVVRKVEDHFELDILNWTETPYSTFKRREEGYRNGEAWGKHIAKREIREKMKKDGFTDEQIEKYLN